MVKRISITLNFSGKKIAIPSRSTDIGNELFGRNNIIITQIGALSWSCFQKKKILALD